MGSYRFEASNCCTTPSRVSGKFGFPCRSRRSVGLVVVAVMVSASACTGSDTGAEAAVKQAMSAVAPQDIGRVVDQARGDLGGTLNSVPFRRKQILAGGPLGTLDQRVATRLRRAGFRQQFPAPLMAGRPAIWESRRYDRTVWVEVEVFNPGAGTFAVRIPPEQLGLSFEVKAGI